MYHFRAKTDNFRGLYAAAMHLERSLTIESDKLEISGFVKREDTISLLAEIESVADVKEFSVVEQSDYFEHGL